jgi:hypothetical protein
MYLRITPFSFDPLREPEAVGFTNDQLIPAFRRAPGFRHYYAASDRTTGRGYAVTVWDTREQSEALRNVLRNQILQGIQAVGIQLETSQVFEVIAEA